jgi:hypothetical protein
MPRRTLLSPEQRTRLFAIQLCLLRYPGQGLGHDQHPPKPMIIFVAQQLGVSPGAFADYALRDQTRREHAVELQPRRSLGAYGVVTLDEARETARDWLRMIKRGIDPRVELAKERAANQRRQQFTFGHVLEEFFTLAASQHKKGAATRG